MSDTMISTAEIISGLRQGEKVYRGFKRGIEVAEAYEVLEKKQAQLEQAVTTLHQTHQLLTEDVENAMAKKKHAEDLALQIGREAEEKAAKIIADANELAGVSMQKANEEVEDAARSLAAVKEEIKEAEVERDKIKSEIRDLEDVKEKMRQQVLAATAS